MLFLSGGHSSSPGVDDWLLEEEAFAELEPRDFRGAEAATAANKNQTLMSEFFIKQPSVTYETMINDTVLQPVGL